MLQYLYIKHWKYIITLLIRYINFNNMYDLKNIGFNIRKFRSAEDERENENLKKNK